MLQFGRTGAETAALQHHIRFRRIGYDHHQQLLVNVNSCYILRHILTFPAREARSARARQIRTVPCFDVPEPGRYEHTYPLQRAFRIRLAYGLDCSKAVSTSFAPAPVEIMPHLEKIFITSDVPKGHQGSLTRAAPIGRARVLRHSIVQGLRTREPAIDILDMKSAGLRGTKDAVLLETQPNSVAF